MFYPHLFRPSLLAAITAGLMTTVTARAQFSGALQPSALNANAALRYYQGMLFYAVDEDRWELLKTPADQIDGEDADALIARSDTLFKLIGQGVGVDGCDWGLQDLGIDTLLSHLHPMRQFGRLSDLRAHRRFSSGDVDGAIDDLLASLRMARHTGSDGVLISRVVGAAMERNSIEVAAAHLHRLTPDQLRRFGAGLDRLEISSYPPDTSFIISEKYFVIDWIGAHFTQQDRKSFFQYMGLDEGSIDEIASLDDRRIRDLLKGAGAFYDQAVPLLKLPYAQRIESLRGLEKRVVASDNPIARNMFPSLSRACNTTEVSRARFAMLRAAVAHRLGDGRVFRAINDPGAPGRPFGANEDNGALTLTSGVQDKEEALTIRFGK